MENKIENKIKHQGEKERRSRLTTTSGHFENCLAEPRIQSHHPAGPTARQTREGRSRLLFFFLFCCFFLLLLSLFFFFFSFSFFFVFLDDMISCWVLLVALVRSSCAARGPSRGRFGLSWGCLEFCGAILERQGAILGPSWANLERSGADLGFPKS